MPTQRTANRINAKTDSEAKKRFLSILQKSLSAVHRNAQWVVLSSGQGSWTATTNPILIPLKSNSGKVIYLQGTIRFRYGDHQGTINRPKERKVYTEEYAYTLSEDDDLKSELYSWHW